MRRLVLVRHAKSSWDKSTRSDHARPLDERGRTEAPQLGVQLSQLPWKPDQILCSDAVRAVETCDLIRKKAWKDVPLELVPEIYGSDRQQLCICIAAQPNDLGCIALIGHNPTMETMVEWLASEKCEFKTANAVVLLTDATSWRNSVVSPSQWRLELHMAPAGQE